MTFAAVLQRRMLLAYLGVMLALYVSAVLTSAGMESARGELGSVALCVTGLALIVPSPLRPRRYAPAVACMCAAPIVAMVFHDLGAAQVWSLIPLMFAAVFVRVWHRTVTARLVAGLIATAAVVALWLSPAAVPWPWYVMFVVSIFAAAEIVGVMHNSLYEAALRDPLTSVWNRAGVERHATDLMSRARRRAEPVAVVVFDVDDFKAVNDSAGHAAGDRALAQLTRAWATRLPASAIMGRLGGDEFVVVLAGFDETHARGLAGDLADAGPLRVSAGTAVGHPVDAEGFAALVASADDELYRIKRERKRGD